MIAAIFIMAGEKIVDCNALALKMFRFTRKDVVGSKVGAFSDSQDSSGETHENKLLEKIKYVLKKLMLLMNQDFTSTISLPGVYMSILLKIA